MHDLPRNYSTRELPWHAFQRLLASELAGQAREGHADLPLHSWLGRALASASSVAQRC